MALWQVGFFLLPKDSIEFINSFKVSNEHTFDDASYWEVLKLPPIFFDTINDILPKGKSWSKNILLYGEENSNRLEIYFENDIIVSVSLRIDYTSDYENILYEIIEFCILNGLIILDEGLNLVPLNFELANSSIKNAPQVKKYNDLSNGRNLK
jgi:hypothetical protein